MILKKSYFLLPYKLKKIKGFADDNVRFPQSLPEKFILEYTKKGDTVFDPFAGFGTTLFAADKLGRIGVGIEYDKKKVDYIDSRIKKPNRIIYGSSFDIDSLGIPKVDLCFTSPPYMRYFDKENPLTNYNEPGDYQEYLVGIEDIFSKLKKIISPDKYLVLEISNTFDEDHPMTTLAWDVGKIISKYFYFERDFIFCFKNNTLKHSYDNDTHSYCLVFKNK